MEQIEKIQGTEKEFIKVFQELCYSRSSWQVWADLMAAMACTLANSVDKTEPRYTVREKEYAECIKRLGGVEKPAKCFAIVVEALERNPDQDFLGKLYMSLELGNHWKGQFFTPYNVCECMASITINDNVQTLEKQEWMDNLFEVAFATRDSQSIMSGCTGYYNRFYATVVENNVERIIISKSDANNLVVGSTVSIGNATALSGSNPTDDRGNAGLHAKANRVIITKIEDYDSNNSAVYVDNGGTKFSTGSTMVGSTEVKTTIVTMPWHTGACDNVLGSCGSPNSNTSGKDPYILFGVEMFLGFYEVISNVILKISTNIQNYLYKLIEMEEETGNHCKAEEIAEITEHMVSLFGLWDYGKVVPHLLIAVYRKDVEKCIQLIKEVLMESQKPWKMVESPLYYRYADTVQGKSFSGVGNNFVRALATEIENKEEYEFLKGNKELEAIFSQYLK